MEITKARTQEIVTLHQEIIGHLKQSLDKAIRIGELLTEQKASLKHGEFTPWLAANIPFTDRTARNYMHLWRERDRIKTESVSDLTEAYRLLSVPKFDDVGFLSDVETRRGEFQQTLETLLSQSGPIEKCSDIGLLKRIHDTASKWEQDIKQDNLFIARRLGQLSIQMKDFTG